MADAAIATVVRGSTCISDRHVGGGIIADTASEKHYWRLLYGAGAIFIADERDPTSRLLFLGVGLADSRSIGTAHGAAVGSKPCERQAPHDHQHIEARAYPALARSSTTH